MTTTNAVDNCNRFRPNFSIKIVPNNTENVCIRLTTMLDKFLENDISAQKKVVCIYSKIAKMPLNSTKMNSPKLIIKHLRRPRFLSRSNIF